MPRVGGRAQSRKRTGAALLRIAKPARKTKSQRVRIFTDVTWVWKMLKTTWFKKHLWFYHKYQQEL